MKCIIVVTHAESQHHIEGKVGGWHDTGLTKFGRSQARATAKETRRILDGNKAALFSSDLRRAHETAEAISDSINEPITPMKGLRENSYGVAEGKPQKWLDDRFIFPPKKGNRLDHIVCEGAESRRTFAERIYHSMGEIYSRSEENAVVVSHGFALTFIISWWINLPIEYNAFTNFASTPGGISLLEEDDKFHNRAVKYISKKCHEA